MKIEAHRVAAALASRNRAGVFKAGDILTSTNRMHPHVIYFVSGDEYHLAELYAGSGRHKRYYDAGYISRSGCIDAGWQIIGTAKVIVSDVESPTGRRHFMVNDGKRKAYYAGCREFKTLDEALKHWAGPVTRKTTKGKGWKRVMARKLFGVATKDGWFPAKPKAIKKPVKKVVAKKARRSR